jgi:two-component system response regulator HydG
MPARHILLVEDEAEVADMLGLSLRAVGGYRVDLAQGAIEARERITQEPYDVVVADWRLPDGNGLEIADLAAKKGAKTILISGYLFQIPAAKMTRHELLMKPMRPTELTEAVRRVLG